MTGEGRSASEGDLPGAVREAVTLAAATGVIGSPVGHARVLELIVETAAQVIHARAAALMLIDEEADELVFEVAFGGKADEVRSFRVPLGQGIAGLVAQTGQPLSITNPADNPQHARDLAESVGYHPESILCVPLFYGPAIIGVLELLDKEGAASFSLDDVGALMRFANLAGVAIVQSRVQQDVTRLVRSLLEGAIPADDGHAAAETIAREVERDRGYQQAVRLAMLLKEIVRLGDREADACYELLSAFARYVRPQPGSESAQP